MLNNKYKVCPHCGKTYKDAKITVCLNCGYPTIDKVVTKGVNVAATLGK
jgi:ribosomal protein L37E